MLSRLDYGSEKSRADGRFEIAGISRKVVEAFSARRAEIEAATEPKDPALGAEITAEPSAEMESVPVPDKGIGAEGIRSLFSYVAMSESGFLHHGQQVLALPVKRYVC